MRRFPLYLALVLLCPAAGLFAWRVSLSRAQPGPLTPAEPPSRVIPLKQVVLFNTGVGYFQRQGAVEGDARVDLSFPVGDINDLLKTLSVDDGGKPGSISYDGAEPIARSLRSFALDLTGNPTFGQILNQARGEKVEVVLEGTAQASTLSGTILGMESQLDSAPNEAAKETHHLNLLTADGMRRLPLGRIVRLRFLNPVLEEELRRALGVLAAGHNSQRRSLSLHLAGEGKRQVTIGYAVETSIWKASYRLALDGKGGKPRLQGWAVIENTSDEDWKDVRLVLVSGRPITFQMDLAQPLFLPRPTVEPEAYASLRPPTHQGGEAPPKAGTSGFQGGGQTGLGGGVNLGALGALGGGFMALVNPTEAANWAPGGFLNRYQVTPPAGPAHDRLTYEELLKRRDERVKNVRAARDQAYTVGSLIAGSDATIESIALDADRIGESFRHSLDRQVTLSRHRSALLPVLDAAVQLTQLSIYNRTVHPHFPLLGLRLKNTTGQHLQQGPAAVFGGGAYLGDCRLPDLQPDQERLVSYAMDLGLEIKSEREGAQQAGTRVFIRKGNLVVGNHSRALVHYRIHNRSKEDRTLLLEHNVAANWAVVGPAGSRQVSPALHHFEWAVPAGKTVTHSVTEETGTVTNHELAKVADSELVGWMNATGVKPAVRDALARVLTQKRRLGALRQEVKDLEGRVQTRLLEQERLRVQAEQLAAGSAARKAMLEQADQAEQQLARQRTQLREQLAAELKSQQEYDALTGELTVE